MQGLTGKINPGIIVAGLIIALLLFYFLFDPQQSPFMPQCLFHRITGYQCVGCGTQRMLHALLHGDFTAAFRANAFAFCALPAILFLLWLEINRKKYPGLYAGVHSVFFIISVGVALLLWMILRNIFGI